MTQPSDPRKVKVIVELIDHTSKIADTLRARRPGRAARAGPRSGSATRRSASSSPASSSRARASCSTRCSTCRSPASATTRRTVLATVVSYGEQASARLIVAARRRRRARGRRDPDRRRPERSAPRAAGRWPRGAARRGHRAQPAAQERAGVRRHPRRRRSRPAAPVGDAGPAARRRRDADGQRHQPGVHRARDDLHPAGRRNLPGGNDCRHQDRPLPALAARSSPPTSAHLQRAGVDVPVIPVSSVLRSHAIADERQGTQRGVELPGDRQVPQREGARPARTTGSATRCSPKSVPPQSI